MKFTLSNDENPGDPGTQAGGLIERDENIKVCNYLVTALQRCGQTVVYDSGITYVDRVAKANQDGTNVLVAIAHNASSNSSVEGSQFIFCGSATNQTALNFGKQRAAANNVGNELVAAGIVKHYSYYFEDIYECCVFNNDTVYCEVAFQTNAQDVAMMKSSGYHHNVAEAVCRGLAKTYGFTYVTEAPPIHWGNFTAKVATYPATFYQTATTQSKELYRSRAQIGEVLYFDGWVYGEPQKDFQSGAPDRRWFHRAWPGYGWIASATVDGNPPNSTP